MANSCVFVASNGYSLYCAELMVNMKDVPSTERMVLCSKQWKMMTQKEKDMFQKRCEQVGINTLTSHQDPSQSESALMFLPNLCVSSEEEAVRHRPAEVPGGTSTCNHQLSPVNVKTQTSSVH